MTFIDNNLLFLYTVINKHKGAINMKKKFKPSQSIPAHIIFTLLSLTATVFFRCFDLWWVFIDNTVKINHFCEILLVFAALNTVIMGILSAVRIHGFKKGDTPLYKGKAHKIVFIVASILSFILFAFSVGYSIGLFLDENSGVLLLQLADNLSKAIPLVTIISLAIFYPALGCKAKRAVAVIVILVSSLWIINDFIPLTPYKITSEPTVIDTSENYSVVFSTNDYGTGYIEYNFEGKDYKVYDHTAGRVDSDSRIHNISVPYEHLRNNTYTIGSTRVIDDFSYGSRLGKNIISKEYTLTYNDSDDQTYLVVSDWHTMLEEAYSAIDYLGEYDAVILMGDSAPGVDYEKDVIKNTVQFAGVVSGGTKPVIYVRGNHETRGPFANDLPDVLGLDELYYTLDMGPYSFIVLDSGEDKEDSHHEYGGLTTYGTYRADMIEWLKTAEATNDKVIALSHSWEISDVEEDLSAAGWNEIDRMGARLMISGHTHQCRLIGTEEGKEQEFFSAHPGIIGYMDGGKSGKNYTASMLTVSSDGFSLKAVNNLGENIFSESFEW